MRCSVCGTEFDDGLSECPNCGAVVSLETDILLPQTVKDTATIRRQALIKMAAEFTRRKEYDSALLIYGRVLRSLKVHDAAYYDIEKRIERLQRARQKQEQQFLLLQQRWKLVYLLTLRRFILQNSVFRPADFPSEKEAENLAPQKSDEDDLQNSPAAPDVSAPLAGHSKTYHVHWEVAYGTGLILSLLFAQRLQTNGFDPVAQSIFLANFIWGAYCGQPWLLFFEWMIGFGISYVMADRFNTFWSAQGLFLGLEGILINFTFFWGSQLNLRYRALLGIGFAFFFAILALFSPSLILLFVWENSPVLLVALLGLALIVNFRSDNYFYRVFRRICSLD